MEAAPLLWWYEPMNESRFFLPALDGHGQVPRLDRKVQVDHTLIVSSTAPHARRVHFTEDVGNLKEYLSDRILGKKLEGRFPNGDFYLSVRDNGNMKLDRLNPKEAN